MTELATTMTTVAAALFAGTLLGPAGVLCVESLGALLPRRALVSSDFASPPKMAILVPAHDEEGGIGKTVGALLRELSPGDRILVIADNCSDRTAEVAREAGAEVIERKDPERRGKGYALSFGGRTLAENPPDVVVIMDADCRVERGSLRQLAELAVRTGRPAQGVYLMHAPGRGGASAVSAFAFMVRNLVRPTGLKRLGMPCQLTGTGMAFPWPLFRDAPPTESFLVEDLLLGHELALRGYAPVLCDELQVGSEFPTGKAASLKQRRRWEHGELSILLGTAPRLLLRALAKGDARLLALAIDAAVPPLALVVLLQIVALIVSVTLLLFGGSLIPLLLTLCGSLLLALGLGSAWFAHGRKVLSLSDLAKIPGYILWKLPLYASFVWRGAHREWERTERS
jgi:cellulose synthase/poly-beta-1,6-N-acetylglucosamine synthase-like glycosyltransferase